MSIFKRKETIIEQPIEEYEVEEIEKMDIQRVRVEGAYLILDDGKIAINKADTIGLHKVDDTYYLNCSQGIINEDIAQSKDKHIAVAKLKDIYHKLKAMGMHNFAVIDSRLVNLNNVTNLRRESFGYNDNYVMIELKNGAELFVRTGDMASTGKLLRNIKRQIDEYNQIKASQQELQSI